MFSFTFIPSSILACGLLLLSACDKETFDSSKYQEIDWAELAPNNMPEFVNTSNNVSLQIVGEYDQASELNDYYADFPTQNISSDVARNMNGRKILNRNIKSSEVEIDLDISSISDGLYIIVMKGAEISQSKRFIISK